MRLDPTNQFIHHIARAVELEGKELLEIGCGSGRITADLAARAREVVAIDPDTGALRHALAQVGRRNVVFLHASAEALHLPGRTFDVAILSLSLHHVPPATMGEALVRAARHVRRDGAMVVLEPGDAGTLIEAETSFDVGDGDERAAKKTAQELLHRLEGWSVGEAVRFRTLFHFRDQADFLENLPPRGGAAPPPALGRFLDAHRDGDQIVLWAERRMNVLRRRGELPRAMDMTGGPAPAPAVRHRRANRGRA